MVENINVLFIKAENIHCVFLITNIYDKIEEECHHIVLGCRVISFARP